MTGHTRNFRAENDPRVARFLYERAALFLQPPSELARLHVSIVTTSGYAVKNKEVILASGDSCEGYTRLDRPRFAYAPAIGYPASGPVPFAIRVVLQVEKQAEAGTAGNAAQYFGLAAMLATSKAQTIWQRLQGKTDQPFEDAIKKPFQEHEIREEEVRFSGPKTSRAAR
jgi:hypothetical protein